MSGPVSLRICCIAAMAPALTEAATQSARVKLPLCSPTGGSAEPAGRLLGAKHLVIERSSGLRNNHIGPLSSKDLHQLVNGDHLQGEVSLLTSKEEKSNYLAIGGKLLDLSSIVNLPQVLRDQLSECLCEPSELVKMNQPIRLFVNGTSKMTVNDTRSRLDGEVISSDKGASLLKNMDIRDDSNDRGGGDDGAPEQVQEPGNSGSGDAPQTDVPPRGKTSPQDLLQDIDRRQHLQERRAQRLMRRLRRLQSRQAQAHVSNQLSEYVSYHHHNLETMAQNIKTSSQQSPTGPVPGTSTDFTPDMLSSDRIRSLSTAALVNLVRKLQSAQSPMSLRQRATQAEAPTTLLRMNKSVRAESDRAADQLVYNLRHIERALDSDATESSSGGESGEEYPLEPMRRLEPSSYVSRSAVWQWSRDRAQVAARWTWLQAQVSDLEYRIRTQSEIYRQLRASKGPIQLTERESAKNGSSSSPANLNNILSNVDRQASHVTQSLGPLTPLVTPSGTPIQSPKRTPNLNGLVEECESPSARCRLLSGYRRRRLFRTQGLYTNSRKAARLSTVSCRCYPPGSSCAMCMGRYNNVMPIDPDMPRNEKLALLDSGYHPVLSFPEDVPLPLVIEPLVRTAAGLQKASPRYLGRSPAEKTNKYRKKYQRTSQSKSKKLKKTAANLLSMKYKTRFSERASSPKQNKRRDSTRGLSRAELRKRKKLKLALKREHRSTSASRQNSTQASPRDSPLPSGSHTMREMKNWLKRKTESNYDIDNIVIPYSVAASTRVEKLEYKEIITPKWRVNPVIDGAEEEPEEEFEDLTDDMFASRHVICEVREKQRYLHFVTSGRKKGGSMRTESGANTPDPFQEPEPQTPPVTPSPMDARRRSSSVNRSRAQSMCESRTCTPDPEDGWRPPVPAWEPRRFPLSDHQFQLLLSETDKTPVKRARKTVHYRDDYVESGLTSVATTPGSSRPATPLSSDQDVVEAVSDPEWNEKMNEAV